MNGRVLLVDDDEDVLRSLVDVFSSAGFDLLTAGDQRSAEKLLERERLDFAVLDYSIPLEDRPTSIANMKNGLAVMQAANAKSVPYVVFTGVGQHALAGVAAANAGGMVKYLFKGDFGVEDEILEICQRICSTKARLNATAEEHRLPLRAKNYADCRVILLADPEWVMLAVVGSQDRVRVKPPENVCRLLHDVSEDAPEPSPFIRWPKASTRRTYVGRAREWLRERFTVEDPAHKHAPLVRVKVQGRTAWTCDIRVIQERDLATLHERETRYREAAGRRERDDED